MPERLRFEREMSDLGLYESESFSDWVKRGNRLNVDFYDRSNSHLQYLGRITLSSNSFQWEGRLINRGDLRDIFLANRLKESDPSPETIRPFAFSPAWARPEDRLFPEDAGRQGEFNRAKIVEQARGQKQCLKIEVWDNAKQVKKLTELFNKAKKSEKEQGFYIVLKTSDVERRAALYFLRATPTASSRDEFTFNLDGQGTFPDIIKYVPGARDKQVIGTVHTHYLKSKPIIEQTTTLGSKWQASEKVEKLVHALSDLDIKAAKDNQFVVYALEADQIHKAMPDGRAINRIKWPTFNILTDALDTFAGRVR